MNEFLFVAIPYAAVAVAVGGGAVRHRRDRFSWSTQSSQFLENRTLFWSSNAWHYGILLILGAHLAAVLFPGAWSTLLGGTTRLYVLEVTGYGLAFLAGLGLAILWRGGSSRAGASGSRRSPTEPCWPCSASRSRPATSSVSPRRAIRSSTSGR